MLKLISSLFLLSCILAVAGFIFLTTWEMPDAKMQVEKTITNDRFFAPETDVINRF